MKLAIAFAIGTAVGLISGLSLASWSESNRLRAADSNATELQSLKRELSATRTPAKALDASRPSNEEGGYSMTRLLWVSHSPNQKLKSFGPLADQLGIGASAHGVPPEVYRLIEGEVLGIGRGLGVRFSYLPNLRFRRQDLVDRLRKKYPKLVLVDESNGVSGETHVARLTSDLCVAVFGSWCNPWSVAIASATKNSTHTPAELTEWATLCQEIGGDAIVHEWAERAARKHDGASIEDDDAYYSVFSNQFDEPDWTYHEQLAFTIKSKHSPIGAPDAE